MYLNVLERHHFCCSCLPLVLDSTSQTQDFTSALAYISCMFQSYNTVDLIKHMWDTRHGLRLKARFRGLADYALALRMRETYKP